MNSLVQSRKRLHWSQRELARKASIAYKSLQLIENGRHNPEVVTLGKLARALGYSPKVFREYVEAFFASLPDAVEIFSRRIHLEGEISWKIHLFDFVDAFRATKDLNLIQRPPYASLEQRLCALIASTVETLCQEMGIPSPSWCDGIGVLSQPWFVVNLNTLKATALVESPIHFRKRNIFVLENFLKRA